MAYGDHQRMRAVPSPAREARRYRRMHKGSSPRSVQRQVAHRAARNRNLRRLKRRMPPWRSLIASLICVLALAGIALRVRACQRARLARDATQTSVSASELNASPYDWSCLTWSDTGRVTYIKDGAILSRAGIDVSEHQEWINWPAVAADGIDFAIIRVGYRAATSGTIVQDNYAESNLRDASAAGLAIGAYFYSQAITEQEAIEEADFALSMLSGYTLSYPVVFDLEEGNLANERAAGLSRDERTNLALAFCERIEQAGLTAMVYGNPSGLADYDSERLAEQGFWYAEYAAQPSSTMRFALWQYSETGLVAGVDGYVDLNLDLTGTWEAEA